jgi:hypothetical protein
MFVSTLDEKRLEPLAMVSTYYFFFELWMVPSFRALSSKTKNRKIKYHIKIITLTESKRAQEIEENLDVICIFWVRCFCREKNKLYWSTLPFSSGVSFNAGYSSN